MGGVGLGRVGEGTGKIILGDDFENQIESLPKKLFLKCKIKL